MARIPTVKIKDPNKKDDYLVINECDFVKGEHVLFKEPKKRAAKVKGPD